MTTETKMFEIKYRCPHSDQIETRIVEFEDSIEFPAKVWADDYGYTLADKGWYSIKEQE